MRLSTLTARLAAWTCALALVGCADAADWSPRPREVEASARRAQVVRLAEEDLRGTRALVLRPEEALTVLNATERELLSVEVRGADADAARLLAANRELLADSAGTLRSQAPVAPGAALSLIPGEAPPARLRVVLRSAAGHKLTLEVTLAETSS